MAAGKSRSKGFDEKRMNEIKPTLINPITPITLARNTLGNRPLNKATARVQSDSMLDHSSIDPSWPPQVAATL